MLRVGITLLLQVLIHIFVIWYGLWWTFEWIGFATAAWLSLLWQVASPHVADIITKRTRIGYLGGRGAVVVTGAGRGLGKAAVTSLVREGYHVIATLRDSSQGASLKASTNAPERVHPIEMDVASDDSVRAGVQKIKEILQRQSIPLVGLINNAGIAHGGPVETTSIRDYDRVNNVNVSGSIRCIQALLPLLRESISLSPRIVNVASVAGFSSNPYMSAYSCSKFAVEALSDALRREIDSHGIAVVCIEPAFIESDMPAAIGSGQGETESLGPVAAKGLSYLYEQRIRDMLQFAHTLYEKTLLPATTFGDLCAHVMNVARADLHTRYVLGGFAVSLIYRYVPDSITDASADIFAAFVKTFLQKKKQS